MPKSLSVRVCLVNSWALIRLVMVKLAHHNVKNFLPLTGLDFTGTAHLISDAKLLIKYRYVFVLVFLQPAYYLHCITNCAFVCMTDLPVTSPFCNAVLKTLENWEQLLLERMNKFDGPPPNYINTYPTDLSAGGGPAILRHKAMLEPDNTPFKLVSLLYMQRALMVTHPHTGAMVSQNYLNDSDILICLIHF